MVKPSTVVADPKATSAAANEKKVGCTRDTLTTSPDSRPTPETPPGTGEAGGPITAGSRVTMVNIHLLTLSRFASNEGQKT